jgi:hypothetical protein
VPVKGSFNKPETALWDAISYVLRNVFVNALKPTIDNSINKQNAEAAQDDRSFLQKVFGRNKKDENEKKQPVKTMATAPFYCV